jgi:DNA-binding HxlR family transcriptional regulator
MCVLLNTAATAAQGQHQREANTLGFTRQLRYGAVVSWAELDSRTCSLARTLEIIGQPWTLLVLRDLFNGIRRFDDLADHLGIARNVLADRLARLTDNGLAERVPYREPGHRARYEYRLTSTGIDLCTVMVAFAGWGDRHLATAAGPPARFEHRGCGATVQAALLCEAGHMLTASDRVLSRPGPGARRKVPVAQGPGEAELPSGLARGTIITMAP